MTNRHCPHAPADECGWPRCSCEDNPDPLSPAKGALMVPGGCFLALLVIIALGALLSGCATTTEPRVTIVEKAVPVAVSCVPKDFKRKTNYPDSAAALRLAANADIRYQLLQVGREERIQEDEREWTVIEGCRKAAPPLTAPSP